MITTRLESVYHVTPAKNVKYILKEGLIPSIGDNASSYGEEEERIYFFPTLEDVETALTGWLGEAFEEDILIALLKVDVTGTELKSNVEFEVYTNQMIPPSQITILSEDIDEISDWTQL